MAANPNAVPVSVEEYLSSSYEVDCDYVDDHVEERSVGEGEHCSIQFEIAGYLREHAKRLNFRVWGEMRVRVAERRYRVPDICVVQGRGSIPRILTEPPLIVIEVLSSEDRPGRVARRLRDFAAMGVRHIWIVDPFERTAMVFENDAIRVQDDGILTAPEIPITINLAERFASIDE
jgi:Uma2 family endonuclease